MTLNAAVVRARVGDIEDAMTRLGRFGAMPVDEFLRDPVYMYAAVDYGRVHEIICSNLNDLREFAAAAVALLTLEGEPDS